MKSSLSPKIVFIVGATAVGKTDVALKLAKHFPCEIVSCDSMQVYRDIAIASSKPSLDERKQIPHHVLDMVALEEKFDVAAFNRMALPVIEAILESKKNVLVVGGSGMYMQVLLDGIFEGGAQNKVLREQLEARAESEGTAVLYAELVKVDSKAAAKIHANDVRRIVRALEVFQTTKKPISELQKNRSGLWSKYPVVVFGLDRDREELYGRINARVDKMFKEGLIDEVKAIKNRNLSLTARRIIGVSEVLAYLNGECPLDKAKELMKMNTRHLAKHQLTWFRKDKRIHWIAVSKKDDATVIADKILKELKTL